MFFREFLLKDTEINIKIRWKIKNHIDIQGSYYISFKWPKAIDSIKVL